MKVRRHAQEADRLASLRSYRVLDTAPDEAFDALARLAAGLCRTPISMISLVDRDRQWFKSRVGTGATSSPRSESLCSDAVAAGRPLVVPDLTSVTRYAALPAVADPAGIRAYAGVPLIGRDGLPLGTLCVIDLTPRDFTEEQLAGLHDLAQQVVTVLELRRSDASSGLTSGTLVPEARQPVTLRRALDAGQFVPHFQPLVDMRDGTIVGLEALVRWQHPERGLLGPTAFLPALESGALADTAARVVLAATCALMVDLRASGVVLDEGVAINVSSRQLTAPGLAADILAALEESGLPGNALTVELTETAEVSDAQLAGRELGALRNAGVHVVADDFGVGWSNLTRLLQLPLSGLKIDKELVTGMVDDPIRDHMVAAAITLAATMGLDVVAEGVETAPVRDRLVALGCVRGQGWLFSRAVAAADVPALLAGSTLRRRRPALTTGRTHRPPRHAAPVTPERRGLLSIDTVAPQTDSWASAVLDALPDATAVIDRSGTIVAVNRTWTMFAMDNGGRPEATGVGVNYLQVCARAASAGCTDADDVTAGLRAVLGGQTVESELEYPCPSPAAGRWFLLRITPLGAPVYGAVVSHVSITRRKLAEQELAHQASHDPLTQLANRTLLNLRLTAAMASRRDRQVAAAASAGAGVGVGVGVGILYIDLDGFKPVNDLYGHDAGDEVLLATAERLRRATRPQDTVARVGGDEFAVVVPATTTRELAALAASIEVALAEAHLLHGALTFVGGSVGTYLTAPGDTVAVALNRADCAMYAVKRSRQPAVATG